MNNSVEVLPEGKAKASIIWLHGLGADGHDFEAIVPELGIKDQLGIRFIFPHAPVRAITINGGTKMRGWYDIANMDTRGQDEQGIRESQALLEGLIEREKKAGIPARNIILAGFSRGGAVVLHTGLRYPEKLGGIMALSTYLPLADKLPAEKSQANQSTPIYMAHGNQDAMIPFSMAQKSGEFLEQLNYPLEWHEYSMGHQVCWEEIQDIKNWVQGTLSE